jgi:hypothetical protein
VFGLAILPVLAVTAENWLWVPYSYAFLNVMGRAAGGAAAFETDFWGLSAREGVQRLNAAGFAVVSVGPKNTGLPWGSIQAKTGLPWDSDHDFTPYARPDADAYYAFERFATYEASGRNPEGCVPLFVVAREGVVLGRAWSCREPP